MVEANVPVGGVNVPITVNTASVTGSFLASLKVAILKLVQYFAIFLKDILAPIGIHLSMTGYAIVSFFVLGAILYSLHKMTWYVIEALVIGIVVAIALTMFGIIR